MTCNVSSHVLQDAWDIRGRGYVSVEEQMNEETLRVCFMMALLFWLKAFWPQNGIKEVLNAWLVFNDGALTSICEHATGMGPETQEKTQQNRCCLPLKFSYFVHRRIFCIHFESLKKYALKYYLDS